LSPRRPRRPLTTTAVAAGIGTLAVLALGPMASAATNAAARHDVSAVASSTGSTVQSGGRSLASSTSGASPAEYTAGGIGLAVAGIGLACAVRRLAH